MKRKIMALLVCMLVAVFIPGCGETLEGHSALSMQDDGYWEERYCMNKIPDGGGLYLQVSVNVKKDMDEKGMLKILDYYCMNMKEGIGSVVEDDGAAVYGVFYKGDTDEELARFKYADGESVAIPEEEQSFFPTAAQQNEFDDTE